MTLSPLESQRWRANIPNTWLTRVEQNENPQTGARGTKREHSPTTQTDDSAKRPRVLGGKAPVSKPITGDGDSDDERIYELKNQGYPDEQVARKLIEEGRVRYVPKTIASRYVRLKQIKDQREDDRLDDELSDWHVGEVCIFSTL